MSFWEKIQNDIKKNIKDGFAIIKEGSAVVSHKIEKLTEEGKRKYKIFNLNTKVQDEFAKLGGNIYDLTIKKAKNPISNKKVIAIISRIKKLEAQIAKLEKKEVKRVRKTIKSASKKVRKKLSKEPLAKV